MNTTKTGLNLPLRYTEEAGDNVLRDSTNRIVIADSYDGCMAPDDPDAYRFIATACNLHDDAHRILSRIGQSLRDGYQPSIYAKMDSGETIADAIEAYLAKAEGNDTP